MLGGFVAAVGERNGEYREEPNAHAGCTSSWERQGEEERCRRERVNGERWPVLRGEQLLDHGWVAHGGLCTTRLALPCFPRPGIALVPCSHARCSEKPPLQPIPNLAAWSLSHHQPP